MTDYHYRADAPYPVPEKLPINPRWARVLMSDYSGKSSELTAITQYIYHHMEFDALDAGIAKCLRSIAMVEMKHLELLGECIRRLGAALFQRGRGAQAVLEREPDKLRAQAERNAGA